MKINFNRMKSRVRGMLALPNARRMATLCLMAMCGVVAFAQTPQNQIGINALENVSKDIYDYVPVVQSVCYALAGVVAVVGAISVYIKMNNEENDVKKSIMMIVGACVFLIAAATSLPLFFQPAASSGQSSLLLLTNPTLFMTV